jgi:hypothetical protein
MNERTFLPVVVPAVSLSTLAERFVEGLGEMLRAIGVPRSAIEKELRQMDALAYAPTQSRSILGTMNEFMFHVSELTYTYPGPDVKRIAMHLAEMPCAPIQYQFPRAAARAVFCEGSIGNAPFQ